MKPSHGGPRREPGSPPLGVWLGVNDAELLRYLRLALAGATEVRECDTALDAEVVITDLSADSRESRGRAVLIVGGRSPRAPVGLRSLHLPSPFNSVQLLEALLALARLEAPRRP